MSSRAPDQQLRKLYDLVGERAVLLPIQLGVKGPRTNDWQKTTFEQTQSGSYQQELLAACRRGGNIGVLLGPSSGNLCAIDIDTDAEVEPFLELNPKLASTLRTNGASGCQIWIRVVGEYPARRINSKLKVSGTDNKKSVAEWRGGNGIQSVIYGKHPQPKPKVRYRFAVETLAIEVNFDEINWPESWGMSFNGSQQEQRSSPPEKKTVHLSVERVGRIWAYMQKVDLAISGKGGSNPTYRLANVLVWGFALSIEQARPFMHAYSGSRCKPLWDAKDIDHKLEDALNDEHDKPRGHLWGKGDAGNSESEVFDSLKKAAVAGWEFRKLYIPPRQKLLDDWFREGDTGFLYSFRGVGKTWLAWAIARAIARGEGIGPWQPGAGAVRVCYLDGEMPAELMQDRDKAFGDVSENLTLINHEVLFEKTGLVLNLAKPEVQQAITRWCVEGGFKVLVIDNLSTLASGVKENDADAWEMLLPWLLDLRRKKIAVLLVHHAGRSGEMRGTSRREDSVFWIIKLERDSDYLDKGCSFLVRFEKNRNSPHNPDSHIWTIKPSADGISDKVDITWKVASFDDLVLDTIRDGLVHCSAIAKELDSSPANVSKAAKRLEAEGKIKRDGRRYHPIEDNAPDDPLIAAAQKAQKKIEERDKKRAEQDKRLSPDCGKNELRARQRRCDECQSKHRKANMATASRKHRKTGGSDAIS